MATHIRDQVCAAVTTLLTGLTTTGANVFQDRIYPFEVEELPCLSISVLEESIEYMPISWPREQSRTMTVNIDAAAKITAALPATLAAICKEVEVMLASNHRLGGLSKKLVMTGTSITYEGTTDQPVGVARMLYEVTVHTLENAPDTAI